MRRSFKLSMPAFAAYTKTRTLPSDAPERATALKKFTINTIFDLINNPKKRAPNKEIATLTSILLGEEVSANDVSQVRKKVRRRNYRD